jgi:DNA-binding CsgD family transcriptional regulator
LLDVARAAGAARTHTSGAIDLLVDGLAANFAHGYTTGLPILRSALKAFGADMPAEQELRWLRPAFIASVHSWDDDLSETISDRRAMLCREIGAVNELPVALNARAVVLVMAGDLVGAASLVEEVRVVTEATLIDFGEYGALAVAALRGNEAETIVLIQASMSGGSLRGEGSRLSAAVWANAVLNNGLGRYDRALAAAQNGIESQLTLFYDRWTLAELIEAAARCGDHRRARQALESFAEMAGASGTDWALGVEARSRALLSDGDAAESVYHEAIERLGRTRVRVELARAHLLYGEWLRRDRRRVDAREQLRMAHEMFTTMGAGAFAGRAERELRATGERVRERRAETRDELTAQEAQIARLARDGVANAEIGARLFISRRTVEYHLSKVFTKLGISSRHELDRVLPPEPAAALAS